ncbi:hypothetical protein Tco_1137905 [Tanacetum coccineum]
MVSDRRGTIVPIGEFNSLSIALVARSGVISKSTDRIFGSHGGQQKDLQNKGNKEKDRLKKANKQKLKSHLIGIKRVFGTWMAFRGNTRDLGSFGEETDKITDLHQIHEEVLFTERGDGVAGIKRCRRNLSSDGVRDLVTVLGHGRLKEDLESST